MKKDRWYKGDKPCPACGEKVNRWGKDNICDPCKRLIELGKGVKQQTDDFSSVGIKKYSLGRLDLRNLITNNNEGRTHQPVYIAEADGSDVHSQILRDTLDKFLQTINLGRKEKRTYSAYMENSGDAVFLKTESVLAFYEFYKVFAEYTHVIHKMAFEKGKNLLANLNSGDISLKDFESKLR